MGGTNKAWARATRLLSLRFTLGMGSGAHMAVVARRVGRRKREENFILVVLFLILVFFRWYCWF